MKIAVPSRHGRLLALCALSAALHLMFLELIARHGAGETAPVPGGPGPLVLRLAPQTALAPASPGVAPGAPTPAAASAMSTATAVAPAHASTDASSGKPGVPGARTRSAPEARTAPAPTPAGNLPSPAAPAAPGAPPLPAAADTAANATAPTSAPATDAPAPAASTAQPALSADVAGGAPSAGNSQARAVVRYRVRMPPAVRLVYRMVRADGAGRAAPAEPAHLDWYRDGDRYSLDMDGVLGRLASSGIDSDSGLQPQRFAEGADPARQPQEQRVGRFDPDGHRVVFADGSAAPDAPGMQDRASVLMQLAGIGLAQPGQLRDVIEIAVAGAGAARVERYQVMGEEQVETGAGRMPAWRLVQLAAPGEARLEVWLAPGQGWLPVQLRLTQADGSSATQVLARSEAIAPPSPTR